LTLFVAGLMATIVNRAVQRAVGLSGQAVRARIERTSSYTAQG
jgi:hypothetical protein